MRSAFLFLAVSLLVAVPWSAVGSTPEELEDVEVVLVTEMAAETGPDMVHPAPPLSSGPPMNPRKLWEVLGWSTPEIGRGMVSGNYLVTTDDGDVRRMRLMNGTSVWNVSLPGAATQPFMWNENVLVTADTFYGLRFSDGSVNFSHPKTSERPSQIFVRQLDGWYTRGDRMVKFYTSNGTVQWVSQPIAQGISEPSAGDCCATAMQAYKGNRIYTVYFANGSLQYTHDMPGDIYKGRIPVYNTYIYAGDSTGTFRAVQDITGDVQWETKLGHGVAVAPGVDGNDIVGGWKP